MAKQDSEVKQVYARNTAFIDSLKTAQKEVDDWDEEKRIAVKSFRDFRSKQSREAYED